MKSVFKVWDRVRKRAGLQDVRMHDLRHSFASFLVNAGHSLYEVQQLLGHADPRTTMRYAHLDQASLLAAAETVSRCLSPEPTAKQTAAPLPGTGTRLPHASAGHAPQQETDETEEKIRPQNRSRQARYTASKAGPFILARTGRGSTRPQKQKKALPNTTGRSTGRGQ